MGKKKKDKGYKYFNATKGSKKSKKSKKGSSPKLKTVRPTVDRKDIKRARKIILAPVDIPKEFTKIREKCNHADELITPAEFRDMTPSYSAFTPMLDLACRVYGEENIHVCKCCYDIVLKPDLVTVDDVDTAVLTLYMAANKAVSLRRMKDDEVEAINKIKASLADWNDIADELEHVDNSLLSQGKDERASSPVNLNQVGNAAVVL